MIPFHVPIHSLDWNPEMTAFPNLLGVAGQEVSSPAYRLRGATRRGNPHILFQLTLDGCGIFKQGRRSYDVRPGLGFLCQSHNPDVTYFYPKGAKDPWTFVYMCFSGSSAVAMADDLVRRHGPIFALDTSDPFVSRMMEYADIAPDGSMVTPVADGAYLVAGLMHRLLSNVQSHPSGDSAPVSAPEANVKLADPPASNYKGDPK